MALLPLQTLYTVWVHGRHPKWHSLPGAPPPRALAWITRSSSPARSTPSTLPTIGASNWVALRSSSTATNRSGWRSPPKLAQGAALLPLLTLYTDLSSPPEPTMTTAFTDCLQIEEFCDLEEYLEDNMDDIMEGWNYIDYPENEDGTYGWSDEEAHSLECAFGPEE